LENDFLKGYDINTSDLLKLSEIGIIQILPNISISIKGSNINEQFIIGNRILVPGFKGENKKKDIPLILFTKCGSEILKLIDKKPPLDYVNAFIKFLES
jgi:hypothetical protein